MSFHVLDAAIQIVRYLRRALERIAKRDADLARQIRRASSSVPLNIAEARQRAGRDGTHQYRVALGSVAEVASALDVAVELGYVDEPSLADARVAIDRVRAMLWKLTR